MIRQDLSYLKSIIWYFMIYFLKYLARFLIKFFIFLIIIHYIIIKIQNLFLSMFTYPLKFSIYLIIFNSQLFSNYLIASKTFIIHNILDRIKKHLFLHSMITKCTSLIFWIIASISYFYNSSLNYVICNISTKTF
jgi:hypothetical protein